MVDSRAQRIAFTGQEVPRDKFLLSVAVGGSWQGRDDAERASWPIPQVFSPLQTHSRALALPSAGARVSLTLLAPPLPQADRGCSLNFRVSHELLSVELPTVQRSSVWCIITRVFLHRLPFSLEETWEVEYSKAG